MAALRGGSIAEEAGSGVERTLAFYIDVEPEDDGAVTG
jgi:hypothetical protein